MDLFTILGSLSLWFFWQCFYFLDQVYCARGTVPKLHIKSTSKEEGDKSIVSTNQAWPFYESHISPLSPSLSGDSSSGQAIPACYRCAPLYYPGGVLVWWVMTNASWVAMRPAEAGRVLESVRIPKKHSCCRMRSRERRQRCRCGLWGLTDGAVGTRGSGGLQWGGRGGGGRGGVVRCIVCERLGRRGSWLTLHLCKHLFAFVRHCLSNGRFELVGCYVALHCSASWCEFCCPYLY